MSYSRANRSRTICFREINDYNNSNHYRFNSTRCQIALMNLKSDLMFRKYSMEKINNEGSFLVSNLESNDSKVFSWEFLYCASAEEVIIHAKFNF